jgi:hypothetical protein
MKAPGELIPRKAAGLNNRILQSLKRNRCCMKISRNSDSQILAILQRAEADALVPALYREQGMSSVAFYRWRQGT